MNLSLSKHYQYTWIVGRTWDALALRSYSWHTHFDARYPGQGFRLFRAV